MKTVDPHVYDLAASFVDDMLRHDLERPIVATREELVRRVAEAAQSAIEGEIEAILNEASPKHYIGPIKVGMRFIWEKDKPHAFAEIEVVQIEHSDSSRCAILSKCIYGRSSGSFWNEESRFREAVTPL